MRYILIVILLLFVYGLKAQVYQEDTTKYIKNPAAYPSQLRGFWATSIFRLPDTTNNRPQQGVPGAMGRNTAGTQTFIWDGSQWIAGTGGVQIDSVFITNIDSIFITNTDSIFIVSGNDTIFIGNSNPAMDTAYQRVDSLFGVKSGIEFLIGTTGGGTTGSLQPHIAGFGLLGGNYDGTAPVTWALDTSVLNDAIFIDSSETEFFVDSIANAPLGTEANGIKYLVGTSPTGAFAGHANEIATLVGGIWTFVIPDSGDDLVVSNDTQPTSFYHFDGVNWHLVKRSVSVGGDRLGASLDIGTLDNRVFRFFVNARERERISAAGHFFTRYKGVSSNNYLKIVDTATGRMDTASFTPLTLTTNGSSGAATLSNDTLNIPVYTGGGGSDDTIYYNIKTDFVLKATGDSITDDGPAIQAAVDWIAANDPGGVLFFPAGNYRDTSHVHWKSNVNALGVGKASNIFNDLNTHTRFGDQAPIFFGNLTATSWDSTDLKYFSASYASGHKVKIVDSISRFNVGDIVVLRGATYWINTDGEVRPHVLRVNRVIAKNVDTIYLEEPLDTTITKVAISGHYIAGSGKRNDAYGQPAIFISDCNISNLKLTSVYGDVLLGSAAFKMNFNNIWTEGKESLGGNGWSFCNFNHIKARFSKQAWENSIGSHNTNVNDLQATWSGVADAENKPIIKFGESVYGLNFTNIIINAGNFPGADAIWFGAATHCTVDGFTIHGEGINESFIRFNNTNNVISNTARNGVIYSGTSQRYVDIEKNAGVDARLSDNLIDNVKAYGNTGATAVLFDGTNTTIKDSYFEDGDFNIGDSVVNGIVENTYLNNPSFSNSNIRFKNVYNGSSTYFQPLSITGSNTTISNNLILSGTAAAHNADDSMLVRKASSGAVGYRAIPTGGTGGGIDSVRKKANNSDSIMQYTGGVGTLAFRQKRVFNVIDYGAKGDFSTDATAAIQAAINAADAAGGGIIYFPNGIYKIAGALTTDTATGRQNAQLGIPARKSDDTLRNSITLLGESVNFPQTGYGPFAVRPLAKTGVILRSTISGSGTNPSVISSLGYFNNSTLKFFNYNVLNIENICIQVYTNHGTAAVSVGGINGYWSATMNMKNVLINQDTTLQATLDPRGGTRTFGLVISRFNNRGPNTIENVDVEGFPYGIMAGEHTIFQNASAMGCQYGFVFGSVVHTVRGNITAQANNYSLYFLQGNLSNFGETVLADTANIDLNIEMEYDTSGFSSSWYKSITDIKDSLNNAFGRVRINKINTGLGFANGSISQQGAQNLSIKSYWDNGINVDSVLIYRNNFTGNPSSANYATGIYLRDTTASSSGTNPYNSPSVRWQGTRWTGSASTPAFIDAYYGQSGLANKDGIIFNPDAGSSEGFVISRDNNAYVRNSLRAAALNVTNGLSITAAAIEPAAGNTPLVINASRSWTGTGTGTAAALMLAGRSNASSNTKTAGVSSTYMAIGTLDQTSTSGHDAYSADFTLTTVGSSGFTFANYKIGGVSRFKINETGKEFVNGTITAGGTTGAQTINKPAGSVNFAATAQTLVVTNSTVTTSSLIFLSIMTDDTTAKSAVISALSAGSFTIKLNAAATAETKVAFRVVDAQ